MRLAIKDQRLASFELSALDIEDVIRIAPEFARAFLTLFEQNQNRDLSEHLQLSGAGSVMGQLALQGGSDAVEIVRGFLTKSHNYFDDLDHAAERLNQKLRREDDSFYYGLKNYLKSKHQLRVRILPGEIMPDRLRFYDIHSRVVHLSDQLTGPSRTFQLGYQLGLLEYRELIEAQLARARLEDDEAKNLLRAILGNYFAAALMMPYGRFLSEAEQRGYDIEALMAKFDASFEQVAHRLTTLQRPQAAGIPFFFIRVDQAGNISKRYSAGHFHFSNLGGTCPLWNIHESFQSPGRIKTQLIEMNDQTVYFSMARTVLRGTGTWEAPAQRLAVALGCPIGFADRLIYARQYNLEQPNPVPIGVNCYLCDRAQCRHRAYAPLHSLVNFDERTKGMSMIR